MPSQTAVVLPVRRKQSTCLRCVEEGNGNSERGSVNRGKVRLWWVFSRALVLTRTTKPRATTRNHADFPRRPPSRAPTNATNGTCAIFYVTIPARAASQYYLLNRIFVSVIPSVQQQQIVPGCIIAFEGAQLITHLMRTSKHIEITH